MGNTFGKKIVMSIFGESHGECVGITISNLPSGFKIDMENLDFELDKRRAKGTISTPRQESDKPIILSGLFNGMTTGAPLTIIFENNNTMSKDYAKTKDIPRPSHSDLSAYYKYSGFNDYRGGGHFSGRLTAAIVAAGAIAKQFLEEKNIYVINHIRSIGDASEESLLDINITDEIIEKLDCPFPVLHETTQGQMIDEIEKSRNLQDSIGGNVEVCVLNMPKGIGEPYFDKVNSRLASGIFSIGGIKSLAFGLGKEAHIHRGSTYNDEIYFNEENEIRTFTNNAGGINGGITNGMPIILDVNFKPTPSISKSQHSINLKTKENVNLEIHGRHDPCICHRGSHVVSAITAFTIFDMLCEENTWRRD